MAVHPVGNRPDLTIEQAQEIFAAGFRARYEVVTTDVRSRHFIVRRDAWSGVGVKLKQRKDGTYFVYTAMIPSLRLQFLFGGIFSYLVLRKTWKALEAEVAEFIKSSPEFKPEAEPDIQSRAA
jgi:hypothetical protein